MQPEEEKRPAVAFPDKSQLAASTKGEQTALPRDSQGHQAGKSALLQDGEPCVWPRHWSMNSGALSGRDMQSLPRKPGAHEYLLNDLGQALKAATGPGCTHRESRVPNRAGCHQFRPEKGPG